MTQGQSRASLRRKKSKFKRNNNNTSTTNQPSAKKKQGSKRNITEHTEKNASNTSNKYDLSRFDDSSDENNEDTQQSLMQLVPQESLENAPVRDFTIGEDTNSTTKSNTNGINKRKRSQEISKQDAKQQYREEKAAKILWRKFDRENHVFEVYYKHILQLSTEEWKVFYASLLTPMPVYVHVNPTLTSLCEIVLGTLETEYKTQDINNGSSKSIEFAPVPWIPDGTLWKLSLDSKSFRKAKELQDLHKYIYKQSVLGTISRDSFSTSLLPYFLNIQSSTMKILDLNHGAERRAVGLIHLLRQFKEHEDESMDENMKEIDDMQDKTLADKFAEGVVVVNTPDASAANLAGQHLSKTLATAPELLITAHKPIEYPSMIDIMDGGLFDRVLCGATPCTGDGLIRSVPEKLRTWKPSAAWDTHNSQLALIEKAMSLVEQGGLLLYHTTSLNPIENEAVVAELLRSGNAEEICYELVDLSIIVEQLELNCEIGLSSWAILDDDLNEYSSWMDAQKSEHAKTLPSTLWPPTVTEIGNFHLDRCVRLLPHQNDCHGLFFVAIRKIQHPKQTGPVPAMTSTTTIQKGTNNVSKKSVFGPYKTDERRELEKFYGFPLDHEDYSFELISKSGAAKDFMTTHLVSVNASLLLQSSFPRHVHVYRAGVEVFRNASRRKDIISATANSFAKATKIYEKSEITDAGAHTFIKLMENSNSPQLVHLSSDEFLAFLDVKEVWMKRASQSFQDVINNVGNGCVVIAMDETEPLQTNDTDLLLVAKKRDHSVTLISSKPSVQKIRVLVSSLEAMEDDNDSQYDSMDFE